MRLSKMGMSIGLEARRTMRRHDRRACGWQTEQARTRQVHQTQTARVLNACRCSYCCFECPNPALAARQIARHCSSGCTG
ncbi:MAG: hypothetical protein QOF46_1775, partial [Paraburkholderia sp.]|nr:hypothetical protein [Paraburkholderia sp.]